MLQGTAKETIAWLRKASGTLEVELASTKVELSDKVAPSAGVVASLRHKLGTRPTGGGETEQASASLST